MIEKLIYGIIYAELDRELGPNPKLWVPADLPEISRMQISIKVITLLAGEEEHLPKSLVIIPFTALKLKSLVKYIKWKDETRRGGIGQGAFIILFKESDDVIFYKYMKNLELLFNEITQEIIDLELSGQEISGIKKEIQKFHVKIKNLLEELREKEISTEEEDAFPEKEAEGTEYRFKVIIIGDPGVGKTSTILRFTNNAFSRTYIPTIGVNVSEKIIFLDNARVKLIFWDVAGQEKFSKMRTHFYQGGEAAIILYDVTRFKSFSNTYNWHKDIVKALPEKKLKMGFLLGNKCDLVDKREVTSDAAEQLANELNLEFYETSALTGENVEQSFRKLAEILLKFARS